MKIPDNIFSVPTITEVNIPCEGYCLKGLTAYVDSLYSTYLVVLIRLSYDDSIYLVIENMTYDWRFNM